MAEPGAGQVPVLVLGASGYVGAECLRLLHHHPRLTLAAAVSRSRAGEPVARLYPHLGPAYPSTCFGDAQVVARLLEEPGPLAVLSALPHGEAAGELGRLLEEAQRRSRRLALVDLSADFRLADPALYAATYGKPHAAPELSGRFTCALPELHPGVPRGPVAHPGCFTTAVTLAARPLVALGLVEPVIHAAAVTGSTGSGREPSATTHHPARHGNLRAYSPLRHRHEPEMALLAGEGVDPPPLIHFVPHSGPFARGIHATLFARLKREARAAELRAAIRSFYGASPFVEVVEEPPAMKDVVGTNRCLLGVEARGLEVVVLSVIDNLTKGAAGGAVQWLNRLLGFEEALGLDLPGTGLT